MPDSQLGSQVYNSLSWKGVHVNISTRREAIEAGKLYFSTGKPCKYGHLSERYVGNGACVECLRPRSNRTALAIISPVGHIVVESAPRNELGLARVQIEQRKLDLRTQRMALDAQRLALNMESRQERRENKERRTQRLVLDAQRAQLALENRAERKVRQHREIVRKSSLIDVIVFIDPRDYETVVTMLWGFAVMRDPQLRRDDIASGRELKDSRFIMRCFGEDKSEILRITDQMFQIRHGVTAAEVAILKEQVQLKLTAQAEDNGQPEYDPR